MQELTATNFDEATKEGVSLIDFWAPWCGPCRQLGPIVEQVAKEMGDQATVAKVNVDEAQELAARFGIRGIPTVFVLKDGELVEKFVGVQPKDVLVNSLHKALNK